MSDQLLYPIEHLEDFVFAKHEQKNLLMDNPYVQMLYGVQSSSASVTGNVYFDLKFTAPYSVSTTSNYYALAFQLGNITENGYNLVPYQARPGIWKTPSLSGDPFGKQIAYRVQQIKASRYYYQDEISNGTYKLYFLPKLNLETPSLSALQNQSVLRFFDINQNYDGPSFAVNNQPSFTANLSGTTTAITVSTVFRPVGQQTSGYFWHRWTTDGTKQLKVFSDSASAATSLYPFYKNNDVKGFGCYFNHLSPVQDSDSPKPYIDLYAYGTMDSPSAHYLSLSSGLINQACDTRFFLSKETLRSLFDGQFHTLQSIWSTSAASATGRLFLDGVELVGMPRGTGRTTALNYSLSSGASATCLYFMSQKEDTTVLSGQSSSKHSVYGETKHLMVFDRVINNFFTPASATSNAQVQRYFGSLTGNLRTWFSFAASATGSYAVDTIGSLTGTVVNDTANGILEGKVDRILGLVHDKLDDYWVSSYDATSQVIQKPVGKLYANDYGNESLQVVGAIFYDKGNAILMNDIYDNQFQKSTQLFASSTGTFGIRNSVATWPVEYLSFQSRKYVNRKQITVVATSTHFAKSSNGSSYFKGDDDKPYTKSNQKLITGIVFYGKNGRPFAITKFSDPVLKPEHHDISLTVNIDL